MTFTARELEAESGYSGYARNRGSNGFPRAWTGGPTSSVAFTNASERI